MILSVYWRLIRCGTDPDLAFDLAVSIARALLVCALLPACGVACDPVRP